MHDRSPAADAGRAADAPRAGTTPASAAQAITPLPGDSLASKTPPTMPVGLPLNSAPLVPLPTDAELASLEIAEEALDSAEVWIFVPSWLASVVVHLVLVLLLALLTTLTAGHDGAPSLVVSTGGPSDPEPELLETNVLDTADEVDEPDPLAPQPLDEPPIVDLAAGTAAPVLPSGELLLGAHALGTDSLMSGVGGVSELKMRLDSNLRQTLLEAGGGTAESEAAVQRALQWLAEHQAYDGSWSFQHDKHPKCHGQCGDNGYTIGHIAATGLALLPFLGAGQTQHDGPHKRNVELGLKYLVRTIKHQGKLGSLWDPHGTMYGHGLASIALCEAYGMTHDQWLRAPTQSVVNFICEAQDPNGGGWRYHPQTPGDTSVVGWQLMALKSAQMAYLDVPKLTLARTAYFLDSVQDRQGATYGYQRPDSRRPATTSIGLLCRMYLGWNRDVRPLKQGVHQLSLLGPSIDTSDMKNNMYYNYYATQVMHHYGGSQWRHWNDVMREYLIKTQSHSGHETGSWYFDGVDQGSGAGGRLYCTAMAAMILEVYYRHMPLYREQSVDH